MVYVIDLTTIATVEDSGGYAHWINREFELGIDAAQLARIATFHEFAALPQARDFFARARREPALSQQIEEVIDRVDPLHPRLLETSLPVAGAVAAVRSLAATHQILYVTRRPRSSADVTHAWLRRAAFPDPSRIFYCLNEAEKWLHALHEATEDEPILFIESQVSGLLDGYRQFCQTLPEQARWLRARVQVLAFGVPQTPDMISSPFPIHPLPDWRAMATILATVAI